MSEKRQPRELRAEKCTAYVLGAFGYRRTELRVIHVWVARYAQHEAALHVEWVEKGKRTVRAFVESGATGASLVVLEGWNHPEAYNWQTAEQVTITRDEASGLTVRTSVTRWASYDPQWAHEFDRLTREHFRALGDRVLADYRGWNPERAEREAEIRARGGVGPFTAGDRVVTPRGPGDVVYRRMDPATDHREVACYSVKLDGVDHAGAIFAASDVRWEGAAP